MNEFLQRQEQIDMQPRAADSTGSNRLQQPRSEQSGGSKMPAWVCALQLRILYLTLLSLGRLDEAMKIVDDLEPLASKIGQVFDVAFCLSTRAWVEFGKAPDVAKLETGLWRVSNLNRKGGLPSGCFFRGTARSRRFFSWKLG